MVHAEQNWAFTWRNDNRKLDSRKLRKVSKLWIEYMPESRHYYLFFQMKVDAKKKWLMLESIEMLALSTYEYWKNWWKLIRVRSIVLCNRFPLFFSNKRYTYTNKSSRIGVDSTFAFTQVILELTSSSIISNEDFFYLCFHQFDFSYLRS